MAYTVVIPRIRAEDYSAFLELLQNDPGFPRNHGKWACLQISTVASLQRAGMTVEPVTICPLAFANYCCVSGRAPSMQTLSAFAGESSKTSLEPAETRMA